MEFEDYSRDFRKKVNLNFVCRVFDCCAVLAFVGGILITLTYGIHKDYYWGNKYVFEWGALLVGFAASFLHAMFWIFLARVGDAINDIRKKYVPDSEDEEDDE